MTIPPEAEAARGCLLNHLAEPPRAVYLHGSAVAGGLRPRSDVDLLAVVNQPLTPGERSGITAELLRISGRADSRSPSRPIELVIFSRGHLAPPPYPARCELLYGEWLREEFETGAIPGPVEDPELTLVLAQARGEAVALTGPDARELLPDIPRPDVARAMGDLLPVLLRSLEGDERNVLLTLARMWRTLSTGEFVPKDVAAAWAAPRLPAGPALVLDAARESYLGVRGHERLAQGQAIRLAAEALRDRVLRALGKG